MRKRKRTVRCCSAAVEMALRSGLVGNDDSHLLLEKIKERSEITITIPLLYIQDH